MENPERTNLQSHCRQRLRGGGLRASDLAAPYYSSPGDLQVAVLGSKIANRIGGDIAALATLPTLGTSDDIGEIEWHLEREEGAIHRLRHEPRMTCADFTAVRAAAIADLGVALLQTMSASGRWPAERWSISCHNGAPSEGSSTWASPQGAVASGRARIDRSSGRAISKGSLTPTELAFLVKIAPAVNLPDIQALGGVDKFEPVSGGGEMDHAEEAVASWSYLVAMARLILRWPNIRSMQLRCL
jgi:hypothetical protein